jgi:SAM-dependent methyltransferase
MDKKNHWQSVYGSKNSEEVSWFQEHDAISLLMIEESGISIDAAIIVIGGGASTLVDDLLARGFSKLTVLDISDNALDVARERLGGKAKTVSWLVGDITTVPLPEKHFALWHDRAVFHFLVEEEERKKYIQSLKNSLKPGGNVIIATFAEDGPEKCSGLPVRRYSVSELTLELGEVFRYQHHERESHVTPSGAVQHFNYCYFRLS